MSHGRADRVRDTSNTAGTGTITVSGTPPSTYVTFDADHQTNENVYYCIVHQTANEWEVQHGLYLGSNQLSRSSAGVLSGSAGAGNLVNFSVGTKDVFCVDPAAEQIEILLSSRTYYVRLDGSDGNTGLVDSASGAFLTIQKAVDIIGEININNQSCIVSLGTGTFTGNVSLPLLIGPGTAYIQGMGVANTTIAIVPDSQNCVAGLAPGVWNISNLSLSASGLFGACIAAYATQNVINIYTTVLQVNATAGYHLLAQTGGYINVEGTHTVASSAAYCLYALDSHSYIDSSGVTFNYINSPAFAISNFGASVLSEIRCNGMTFNGSATVTGQRFKAEANGVIWSATSANPTYIPGSVDGTTSTGGQYL